MSVKIKTALLSVYDKTGILELAAALRSLSVKLISTGGTYKLLKESGFEVTEISEYTNFPEMMDGRLKTLHPIVHGGLLGRAEDATMMATHGIEKIDLIVVNLYPFEETVKNSKSDAEIIEKIDIGGPAMLRSAAKNFKYTTVVSCIVDYQKLTAELDENNGVTTLPFRHKMAAKVFELTAFYDSIIANWFNDSPFERELYAIPMRAKQALRYGENSHQKAVLYENIGGSGIVQSAQLQGKELSYNNLNDADIALEISRSFSEPCVAIIKHANPCGIATGDGILDSYLKSLECDTTSAFGGIVSLNREVSADIAVKMCEHFYEVIIAPSYTQEAIEVFAKKKNLRILISAQINHGVSFKSISGGMLMQEVDNIEPEFEVAHKVSEFDINEVKFSFKCVKFMKSNAIVITQNNAILSSGIGQTSRIDSTKIACEKAKSKQGDLSNAILASDAFFPFADNIEIIAQNGIKTIVAPSGSVRDGEVIEACKKYGINLIFAKTRHFRH